MGNQTGKAKTLGFGIIGAGSVAPCHIAAIEMCDNARLSAIAGASEEHARKLGEEKCVPWYTDYKLMLKNPNVDVVCVCTPVGIRASICIDAARAGKHIVAEKPLETTLEKIDSIISECDRAGVKFAVIFQNRFADGVQALRKAVEEGRLGRLVLGDAYVKWQRPQEYFDSAPWRGTWELGGGGVVINHAIHYIDLLQMVMGPVESVFAYTGTLVRERIDVEDTAVACLRFRSGAIGVIEACISANKGAPARLEVRGDKGTVVIEDGVIKLWEVENEEPPVIQAVASGSGASDPMAIGSENHRRQIQDMINAIIENRAPAVDGREGRKAVEIVTAIYRSSQTGKKVELPL